LEAERRAIERRATERRPTDRRAVARKRKTLEIAQKPVQEPKKVGIMSRCGRWLLDAMGLKKV
jgi:hypothetical protein